MDTKSFTAGNSPQAWLARSAVEAVLRDRREHGEHPRKTYRWLRCWARAPYIGRLGSFGAAQHWAAGAIMGVAMLEGLALKAHAPDCPACEHGKPRPCNCRRSRSPF